MSALVAIEALRSEWEQPLDEAVWEAWVARGRAKELRNAAARSKAMKLVCVAALVGTAVMWSQVTPYDVVIRFLVAVLAIIVMSQAIQAREYALATVFGSLALLYNPVVPVFTLSGNWQRVVVVASAVPFVVSLRWTDTRTKNND